MALIIVYAAGAPLGGTLIMKGFLDTIPRSLDEAAKIDGATNFAIFRKIILPLSKPMITYMGLTLFVGPWVDFIFARLVLRTKENWTLAVGLWDLVNSQQDSNFTLFAAAAVLIALPITILFVFLQRMLVDGMVITDGVFSMDGDIAKLPEIVEIAEAYDLITYVDDAHGSGVLGGGAGTVKHFGLSDRVDIQIGTLSKAVGVVGGYVAGSRDLVDWLKVRSRPFLFSTALPPGTVAACISAVDILQNSNELQTKLWENTRYLQEGLKNLGYSIGSTETPITPCIIGDEVTTQKFSIRLYEEGVYAKAIVFPTVPKGTGRVRNMKNKDV